MYAMKMSVSDHVERFYKVDVNAYWITIYDKNNNILVKRHANEGPWMDDLHRKVTDALVAFEKAIFDLVDMEANARKLSGE